MKSIIYGYTRVSTMTQKLERQIRNIKEQYPSATIVSDQFTGTTLNRPAWSKLYKKLKKGDTVIFDSVSRMSRNADEGVKTYFELFNKGVTLIFLQEPYINSSVYAENLKDKIELQGTDEDEIFKGLNNYFRKLAERQIKIAFEQSQKERDDLSQRTKEGIETARLNGKQIGAKPGATWETKKAKAAKKIITARSKDFGGSLSDPEVIKLCGISRNSFYKFKRELKIASIGCEGTHPEN